MKQTLAIFLCLLVFATAQGDKPGLDNPSSVVTFSNRRTLDIATEITEQVVFADKIDPFLTRIAYNRRVLENTIALADSDPHSFQASHLLRLPSAPMTTSLLRSPCSEKRQ